MASIVDMSIQNNIERKKSSYFSQGTGNLIDDNYRQGDHHWQKNQVPSSRSFTPRKLVLNAFFSIRSSRLGINQQSNRNLIHARVNFDLRLRRSNFWISRRGEAKLIFPFSCRLHAWNGRVFCDIIPMEVRLYSTIRKWNSFGCEGSNPVIR